MLVNKKDKPIGEETETPGIGIKKRVKGSAEWNPVATAAAVKSPFNSTQEDAAYRLAVTAAQIQNNFVSPMDPVAGGSDIRFMNESDPQSKQFIEDVLFAEMPDSRPSWTAEETPWSAATSSAHVKGFLGVTTNEEAQAMGFRPASAHYVYIGDAFKARKRPDYKYDFYEAQRLSTPRSEMLEVGDMVFRGYHETEGWGYRDFRDQLLRRDGEYAKSHTDIIVSVGTDAQGRKYYEVAGGNTGPDGDYMLKRMYPEDIRELYAGAMIARPNQYGWDGNDRENRINKVNERNRFEMLEQWNLPRHQNEKDMSKGGGKQNAPLINLDYAP